MHLFLSRGAQILLVRLFFIVIATGALYGIWDNHEFLTRFPFYLIALADALFAVIFIYLAIIFPQPASFSKKLPQYSLVAYWLYSVTTNTISIIFYTYQIGLEHAAQNAQSSVVFYILSEAVYILVLPSIVFALIFIAVQKVSALPHASTRLKEHTMR